MWLVCGCGVSAAAVSEQVAGYPTISSRGEPLETMSLLACLSMRPARPRTACQQRRTHRGSPAQPSRIFAISFQVQARRGEARRGQARILQLLICLVPVLISSNCLLNNNSASVSAGDASEDGNGVGESWMRLRGRPWCQAAERQRDLIRVCWGRI